MENTVTILKFDDLQEGLERSFNYQIKESDIDQFASLSGDYSPLHMNSSFAQSRGFEGRVVHGAFVGGFTPDRHDFAW